MRYSPVPAHCQSIDSIQLLFEPRLLTWTTIIFSKISWGSVDAAVLAPEPSIAPQLLAMRSTFHCSFMIAGNYVGVQLLCGSVEDMGLVHAVSLGTIPPAGLLALSIVRESHIV
jgi:hypothetical protein